MKGSKCGMKARNCHAWNENVWEWKGSISKLPYWTFTLRVKSPKVSQIFESKFERPNKPIQIRPSLDHWQGFKKYHIRLGSQTKTRNTSYDHLKGHESNWQNDFWTFSKVKSTSFMKVSIFFEISFQEL